jgi:hypothetical protein
MPQSTELALSLAKLCADQTPANLPAFVETLNTLSPGPVFHHALTRGGWYRPGGVVSADGERVADSIGEWAEREAEGDVLRLLARYADDGLLATRLDGQTHYFVARLGEGPAEFLQLEVEELREMVDRPLVNPGWIPDNLGEFLNPAPSATGTTSSGACSTPPGCWGSWKPGMEAICPWSASWRTGNRAARARMRPCANTGSWPCVTPSTATGIRTSA